MGDKKNDIDLSLLDLKSLIQDAPKNKKKNDVRKKQIKAKTTIIPPVVYSSNCMTWNKKMILRKSKRYDRTINKYSRLYRVDGNLVRAVITAESCFKRKALSSAGAQGLMQLIPATAERFGVRNSYDAKQNIRGGVKYLKFLLARYKGDFKKAIAAYNAGEGKVDKYNGIPPYKETKQYVKNVLKVYRLLSPKPKITPVKKVYYPQKIGQKPGRHGWQYNRRLAPHLYKQ